MSKLELLWLLVILGGLALFTLPLVVIGLRQRRANDEKGLALRAAEVAAHCNALLSGPDFLWAVWRDTDSTRGSMKEFVRNARDEVVTTIEKPTLPLDGITHRFDLGGEHYEIFNESSLLSTRACLRKAGTTTILLSADHALAALTVYRGDGEEKLVMLPVVLFTAAYRPLLADGGEVGKLIIGIGDIQFSSVLTLSGARYSLLEQVFVIALT